MSTFPPPTDHSEALVEANLGLARQAAWRWSKKTGQPYEDLESRRVHGPDPRLPPL
jgi:hypothetical protein